MAVAKKKRRTTGARNAKSHKRTPQRKAKALPKKRFAFFHLEWAWSFEILSVACWTIGLFLALSFGSHYYQASQTLGYIEASGNLMGPIGHVFGTMLYGSLGWVGLAPALWAFALGSHFASRVSGSGMSFRLPSPGVAITGMCLQIMTLCGLAAVIWGTSGGGWIGLAISQPLVRYAGLGGALLTFAALFLLSARFITQRSFFELYGFMFRGLVFAVRFTFVVVPAFVWWVSNLAWEGGSWLYARIREFFGRVGESAVTPEEVVEELPKPRKRKNTIAPVVEESETIDEPTHIVVKRRTSEQKSADKLLKRMREKTKAENRPYVPPPLTLLKAGESEPSVGDDDEQLLEKSRQIEAKLKDFGISGKVTQVHPGPVITLFEFEPAPGVKVGKIASLQDDLAMSLRASAIRIIAPIPKKGTVGIEVPNRQREIVRLRDVLESEEFVAKDSVLNFAIGKDSYGDPVVADIATMPHLLVAGATGTGKSVSINALLISLLYRADPSELGLILIDPKILELSVYEGIPHLRVPVVTVPRQARAVLEWAVKEMNRRYRLMQKYGVRNIDSYNALVKGTNTDNKSDKGKEPVMRKRVVRLTDDSAVEEGVTEAPAEPVDKQESIGGEVLEPMPKFLIVIDELADLMLSVGREIEDLIARLAQKARAAGIHLLVATQRPSVDVITGLIKANFPARVSFRVSSRVDSRTILDSMGAEKLLGLGDMLFQAPGAVHLKRCHGAFVSDSEVTDVIAFLKENSDVCYDEEIMSICEKALEEDAEKAADGDGADVEYDPLYDKAVEFVVQKGQASTSMLQRAFRIGYNRAARIIDTMERDGVIGPMDGAKPREVLLNSEGGVEPGE